MFHEFIPTFPKIAIKIFLTISTKLSREFQGQIQSAVILEGKSIHAPTNKKTTTLYGFLVSPLFSSFFSLGDF